MKNTLILALALATFPFATRATTIDLNLKTAPDVHIAGTLNIPQLEIGQAAPLVVLVSGTGEQNRDASNIVPGYAPHAQWAEILERRGVATFRYDKRGVGQSGGEWAAMTLTDHVSDIATIISVLTKRPEIDPEQIIVMGHSEGALIAMMLAQQEMPLAGVVLLAGPGWELHRILSYQAKNNTERGELSEADYAAAVQKTKRDFLALIDSIPNLKSLMDAKPLELAANVCVPLLIVQGAEDVQVLPQQAGELAAAAALGKSSDITLRVFPAVNHLLTPHDVGAKDYSELPVKDIAAPVAEFVSGWIAERYSPQGGR